MNKNKIKTKKQILKGLSTKNNFWSLEGSLKSDIKLSNEQLKKARESFSKNWAQI
ncbi:MAG: hypothetical protein AAB625_00595 [Patescibacteria group bacterium]